MSASDIARRFERRNGYTLIDYADVALPLYRLTVDAVTMVHHEIPPIKQFIMRAIELGIASNEEIAGILGIDVTIVDATVDQLRTDRYIGSELVSGLTSKGADVLSKAKESEPKDEMLVFLYDRLLLEPIRIPPEQLLTPANIDPKRMIEIRPYPAEGPNIENIDLPDLVQVLAEQAGGRASLGKDVLQLKRIVRRVRLYRPGVALVYKKIKSSEIQIAFVIDEAKSENLEHVFAERGGPKKMGLLKSIDESTQLGELRRYLGSDILRKFPEESSLDEKRLAVSLARIKRQAARTRLERSSERDVPLDSAESEAMIAASEALAHAEAELAAFPARPIAPFEVDEILQDALKSCSGLLVVSSSNVDRSVVDSEFLRKLEDRLRSGCQVVFILNDVPKAEKPVIELEKLNQKYANFRITTNRRGQFHFLICDERMAMVTNRPLLGNPGKVKSFHQVLGYILQRQDIVAEFTAKTSSSAKRQIT